MPHFLTNVDMKLISLITIFLRSLECSKKKYDTILKKKKFFFRFKATVIDGKSIANTILNELRQETQEWILKGNRAPSLVAVLVGQNPASKIYVSNKMKAAKVVGCYIISMEKNKMIVVFNNTYIF